MTSLFAWLHSDRPTSITHARVVASYGAFVRFLANPASVLGAIILLAVVVLAFLAPILAPYGPYSQNLSAALQPPSAAYWMGTDELGRDILSRILFGARITLMITVLVALVAGPIGLAVGCVAGYAGGWVDIVLSRIIDVFLAFPSLVLALAFVAALGPNLENAVIAIALSTWPAIARLARAEAMSFAASDAVAAVRSLGASPLRIVALHVVPMCLPSVIVRLSLNMAGIILTAAGLGFLGLGAQPPLPEWGAMLSTGRQYMFTSWWLAAMPGMAILIVSLGFNLVGDGLRDVLDPHHD